MDDNQVNHIKTFGKGINCPNAKLAKVTENYYYQLLSYVGPGTCQS